MRISVFGCGRWGSFIAWYLSNHNNDVCLWGNEGHTSYEVIKNTGKNDFVTFNGNIELTSNLQDAISFCDIAIISISSQGLREFMARISKFKIENKIFVLCMKGIEIDTGKRLSEVVLDFGIDKNKVAVWVGPGHIQEFTMGHPNCMVIDSYNKDLVKFLCDSFKSELIRFYYGDDIIGSEIGSASKNVMGIAAGMLDGCGYTTLKGPLMSRGAKEVARLIKAMGGNELSAYGLCHLGDYETTLFSDFSNNRKFGIAFARGEKFSKLAEGVSTSKALNELSKKYNVEMPITNAVYSILYEDKDIMKVFNDLFSRSYKKEF